MGLRANAGFSPAPPFLRVNLLTATTEHCDIDEITSPIATVYNTAYQADRHSFLRKHNGARSRGALD